jgi:uncharacterized HAD superfamily protein
MKLGFDIDGIVADMAQSIVDYINKNYDLEHTVEVFIHHQVSKNKYVEDKKLNKKIIRDIYDNFFLNDDIVLATQVFEGAVETIHKLRRHHSVHFITSRSKEIEKSTAQWLRNNKIPFDSLHVVGMSPPGGSSKAGFGRQLNLDFYIDDQVKHLEGMYKYKKRWFKAPALYRRPWNKIELVDKSKFVVVNNWPELMRHLGIHGR